MNTKPPVEYRHVCINPDDPAEHCNRQHATAYEAQLCRNRLRKGTRALGWEYVAYESVVLTPEELARLPQTTMEPELLQLLAWYDQQAGPAKPPKPKKLYVPKDPAEDDVSAVRGRRHFGASNQNRDRGSIHDSEYHGGRFSSGEW